jgi:hypothetical protein
MGVPIADIFGGILKGGASGGVLGAVSGGVLGAVTGGVKGAGLGKKRRRKARLTTRELYELTNIKNILGRTAAANALPFYLGRG